MHTLTQFKLCPQSRSIRLVLNELQIDFETREERPWEYRDELLAMNPSGELPVLSLSGGPILCGSYAISEYIAEEFKTANGAGRSVSLFPGSREDRAEDLPQYVGQDATVAVVLDLDRGVDAAQQRHRPPRAVGALDL